MAIALSVTIVALTAAPQAAAHGNHASCRDFGQEHAFFAQTLGGLGEFHRDAAPLSDEVAFEHALFCAPK